MHISGHAHTDPTATRRRGSPTARSSTPRADRSGRLSPVSAADADGPRSAALITLLALNGVVRGSAWPAKSWTSRNGVRDARNEFGLGEPGGAGPVGHPRPFHPDNWEASSTPTSTTA